MLYISVPADGALAPRNDGAWRGLLMLLAAAYLALARRKRAPRARHFIDNSCSWCCSRNIAVRRAWRAAVFSRAFRVYNARFHQPRAANLLDQYAFMTRDARVA